MKIGIITFHSSNNCGSMLQGFALQRTLKKMGVKNEIINFSNAAQRHMYALLRKPTNWHDILYDAATLFYFSKFRKHYNDYREFLKNYLELSERFYASNEELAEVEELYDAFITGSDQVWNICCPDADDAYFLNFVKNKPRIAYAPSFGATCLKEKSKNPEKYIDYLNRISALSIRENNGAKWIKELISRDVPVLIDPTMFLSKEEYLDLAKSDKLIKGEYIFYYAFNYSDSVNEIVKKISEKLKMPVYILDVKSWVKKAKKYGFILSEGSGPITFLNLLMNAELVLTTSFHGTVFSILGEKKFWFVESSMHDETDDRAATLLEMFELQNRVLETTEVNEAEATLLEDWDYGKVSGLLNAERARAVNFLESALQNI